MQTQEIITNPFLNMISQSCPKITIQEKNDIYTAVFEKNSCKILLFLDNKTVCVDYNFSTQAGFLNNQKSDRAAAIVLDMFSLIAMNHKSALLIVQGGT